MVRRSGLIVPTLAALVLAPAAPAGPLAPPAGAVSPTNKTLQQVEPRIPINAENTPGDADATFVIDEPGSYYLTENLVAELGKDGIHVGADPVWIDLNGFKLEGNSGGDDGIFTEASNLTVINGTIEDWTGDGINAANRTQCHFESLSINRCGGDGILAGPAAIVRHVHINQSAGDGMNLSSYANIDGCYVNASGGAGIRVDRNANIRRSTVLVSGASGIDSDLACLIEANIVEASSGAGIDAGALSTVRGNLSRFNSSHGIVMSANGVIVGNACHQNGVGSGAAGIRVSSGGALIDGNHCVANDVGISAVSSSTTVIRNSAAQSNVSNFVFGSTLHGPVISGSGPIASTNPWANFSN